MKFKLLIQACTNFLLGIIAVSLLLFLPAGSIRYWNAWIFIGVLFIPMFIAGMILLRKSPDLLAKRLNTKEKEIKQKQIIVLSLFLSMPIILGSVYTFIIFLICPILIIKRIKNEEAVLKEGLDGYTEYTRRVKYRLIPYIW